MPPLPSCEMAKFKPPHATTSTNTLMVDENLQLRQSLLRLPSPHIDDHMLGIPSIGELVSRLGKIGSPSLLPCAGLHAASPQLSAVMANKISAAKIAALTGATRSPMLCSDTKRSIHLNSLRASNTSASRLKLNAYDTCTAREAIRLLVQSDFLMTKPSSLLTQTGPFF